MHGESGTLRSYRKINLDGQPVYLLANVFSSAKIRQHYLSEEAVSTLTIIHELGDKK